MSEHGTRVDCHVKVLDEGVVERAKARGIDVLVYAPHFTRLPTIRRRAERFSDEELLVVPAREVFAGTWQRRRHVLGIGLSEPVPDFLTLTGTMAELNRQGGAILVPHPEFLTVSLTSAEVGTHRELIDAIEVYNPKHLPSHNRAASVLARDLELPRFGSSYAHLCRTVGEVWTRFERPIESEADLVSAFQERAERQVERRRGLRHQLRCATEFCHLGYENSWVKFDRVMLQGTEATHPDHVAYEGRFDDVKVY